MEEERAGKGQDKRPEIRVRLTTEQRRKIKDLLYENENLTITSFVQNAIETALNPPNSQESRLSGDSVKSRELEKALVEVEKGASTIAAAIARIRSRLGKVGRPG